MAIVKNYGRRGSRIRSRPQVLPGEAGPERDMPGFRQNEFFEFNFDPGKAEAAASDVGEVGGKPLEKLAGDAAGFGLKNFAKGVVVDGFAQIVPGGGAGKGRNGKDSGAENGLGFAAFGVGHAEVAGELQVDKGERGRHGVLV